jgi:regulator of replication initiation timing
MYVNEGAFSRLKETAANAIVERDQLKAENAKLRKHLNELLMIGSLNGSCRRDCRHSDDCLADRFGQFDCFVCQELKELGIEVGE